MTAFKFVTIRGEKYVDVRLWCGETDKSLQLAGGIKVYPEEWTALSRVLAKGAADIEGVLIHFEEVTTSESPL